MQDMFKPKPEIRLDGRIVTEPDAYVRPFRLFPPHGHGRIVSNFGVVYSVRMQIKDLLTEARGIWGPERLTLSQIIVRLGVDVGDLCRHERNADKDHATHTDDALKQQMGNIIFSMIRWCDDLGFDPEECIANAKVSQKNFAQKNTTR